VAAIEQVRTPGVSKRIGAIAAFVMATAALLGAAASAGQVGDVPPPPGTTPVQRPPRASDLMRSANDCYRTGDYEGADALYLQADQNRQQLSPAEQKQLDELIKANAKALKQSRDGAVQLRQANQLFQQGKLQDAATLVRAINANPYLKAADRQQLAQLSDQLKERGVVVVAGSPAGKGPATPEMPKDYRTLVKMARIACDHDELDNAELYCKKAAEVHPALQANWMMPFSDNEDKIEADVKEKRLKMAATKAAQAAKAEQTAQPNQKDASVVAGPAVTAKDGQPAVAPQVSKDTLEARAWLEKGKEAIRQNDLATARKCADQAKAKIEPTAWVEQRAYEQLMGEIQRRQGQVVQASATAEAKDKGPSILPPPLPPGVEGAAPKTIDPKTARAALQEARALYTQNKFEDAERLCAQVAAVKASPPWGLFEDTPKKLRDDIISARQRADKAASIKALADARKLLAAGNFQEARVKAWQAKQLHGPYGMMELGDRPDRVLSEIDAAEAKQRKTGAPPAPGVAKDSDPKTGNAKTGTPSVAALSAKQRAQGLLEEARALQKQDNLVAAQAKAKQAQSAALEAQKGGYGFGPGEESPDIFLSVLAVQAKTRITLLVQMANDQSTGAVVDPARQQKAVDNLTKARELALNFGLDSRPIETRLDQLQGRRDVAGGVVQTGGQEGLAANRGEEMLRMAREEIRAGRYEAARKLAEDAFDAKYGVQKQAEMVLRSIDIEEFEQHRLQTERAFINAYEAYLRKDYRAAQTILAMVDTRQLSPERLNRMREIAMDPNMQPTGKQQPEIRQIQGQQIADGAGTARVSDQPGSGVKGEANKASLETAKQMDDIVFDKATKDGLAAQKEALQRVGTRDYDGAIDILRSYKSGLIEARLSQDQMARLTPAIDRQIQQYQTRKAQDAWAQNQKTSGSDMGGKDRERDRIAKKQERDAEMAKMMDTYNTLMREHKFKEAYVQAEHAQELDPDSVVAHTAVSMAKMASRVQEQEQISKTNELFQYKVLNNDKEPVLETREPVSFDPDITRKAQARKNYAQGVTSEYHDSVERNLERILQEKKVTLNLVNVPLKQAIDDIREMVGDNINIIFDHTALEEANIRYDRPLTQSFTNLSLRSALNILLKDAKLTYIIKDQTITITTDEYARGKHKTVIYSVTDLVVPIDNHPSLAGQLIDAAYLENIDRHLNTHGNGYGANAFTGPHTLPNGQQVGSASGGSENTLAGNPPKPVPGQTLEELLMRLIRSTIAPDSWSDVGGKGTIQYFPLGMALVVNQTQDIQEQIVDLLQALRRLQDLEVAIELRLVSVSEAFFEYMGVNFDMNILMHNQNANTPILTSGVFQPNGFINNFQPRSFVSGLTPAGTFTPDLGVPIQASSFDFATPPFGGFPGTLGGDGGISLGLAFLSDIQVFMFMEAAQGDRRTNVMQAPKITVFNGQAANITVTDTLEFIDSITVNQIAGQTVFTPQQDLVPYGVILTVTPVVSADRRFVRMNLNPTLQNLISATVPLVPIQQIVPQLLYDNLSPPQPQIFTMFFQQPSTSTITLNTTVVVPDGGTVLMGGLKTLVEGRNEYGPPVLGKIPYLSRLFTNVGYGREAQSLMIMVTARIIINEEEEQEFLGTLPRIPR
jgi:type II secretory pathway component GspD/PulD (secretin)